MCVWSGAIFAKVSFGFIIIGCNYAWLRFWLEIYLSSVNLSSGKAIWGFEKKEKKQKNKLKYPSSKMGSSFVKINAVIIRHTSTFSRVRVKTTGEFLLPYDLLSCNKATSAAFEMLVWDAKCLGDFIYIYICASNTQTFTYILSTDCALTSF